MSVELDPAVRRLAEENDLLHRALERERAERQAPAKTGPREGGRLAALPRVAPLATPKLIRLDVARMTREDPPPVEYFIEGIAARGYLTMLSGREKLGKSLIVKACAIAVADGGGCVAGIACEPGRVLIVDAENSPAEAHKRIRGLGLPTSAADAGRFHLYEARSFNLGRDLDELVAVVDDLGPDLLVLDSFRSLWPVGEENDSGAVAAVLDPLRAIVHERPAMATVMIHHESRAGRGYRGSTGIGASVENILSLARVDGDPDPRRLRLRHVGCRFDATRDDRWLRVDADPRLGVVFVDEVDPFVHPDEPERSAPVRDALAPRILAAATGAPRSRADLARAVGRDPKDRSVGRVLTSLHAAGQLHRVHSGYVLAEGWQGGGTLVEPATPATPEVAAPCTEGSFESLGRLLDASDEERDEALEAVAERLRADYLADVAHAARCRCDRPLLAVDDDGDAACGRCGRAAA